MMMTKPDCCRCLTSRSAVIHAIASAASCTRLRRMCSTWCEHGCSV
jgi:hypothetical protein